eukprot:jgi/Hompol1/4201/HPOL_006980-RA
MLEKIRFAFFESIYIFLDGLQLLSTRTNDVQQTSDFGEHDGATVIQEQWLGNSGLLGSRTSALPFAKKIATEKRNQRLKVHSSVSGDVSAIDDSKAEHLVKGLIVPKLAHLVEVKLETFLTADVKNLCDTADYLENLLIQNYVRKQAMTLHKLVESGVLYSGLDWSTISKPQEVRSYCYQILLHLVLVHATISEVSKQLIPKIMSEILYSLACALLMAYRKVDSFSTSGMLQ